LFAPNGAEELTPNGDADCAGPSMGTMEASGAMEASGRGAESCDALSIGIRFSAFKVA
jgi:hypothetical protein